MRYVLLIMLVLVSLVVGCTKAPEPTPVPLTATPVPSADTLVPIPTPSKIEARVIGIVDGDTIHVSIGDDEYFLRYIGIDCPESKHPRKPVEWMAPEAAEANHKLVEGKTVLLEQDVSNTDRYNRLLRYVWIGDMMVNEELVRQGFAYSKAYEPDTKYQNLLNKAEQEAKVAKRGVWGDCPTATVAPVVTQAPTQPSGSMVRISAYGGKANPEYIEIHNSGTVAQDMTGWRLVSVTGNQVYRFPGGYVLAAGASVRVYSGKDAPHNPPTQLRWTTKNTWNNKGDPAQLYDSGGNFVDSTS